MYAARRTRSSNIPVGSVNTLVNRGKAIDRSANFGRCPLRPDSKLNELEKQSWKSRVDRIFIAAPFSIFTDGKYHMLSSGELMILNITREDAERTYRCRTHHRLTQETVVSNNVGRLQLTGELIRTFPLFQKSCR